MGRTPEIYSKNLELLRQAVPSASRIAILWNPGYPGMMRFVNPTKDAAQRLGLMLQSVEVRTPSDFDSAFALMLKQHVEAFMVLADPLIFLRRNETEAFAAKYRLRAIYPAKEFVEAGGLMSWSSRPSLSSSSTSRRPKALGVTIPPSLLLRADQVIE